MARRTPLVDTERADAAPLLVGGQALLEGVLMRHGHRWAAAARRPDDRIVVTTGEVPLRPWRRLPLVRGSLALLESAALGIRATAWAARHSADDPDDESSGFNRAGVAISVVLGAGLAVGLFGLLPAAAGHWLAPGGGTRFQVVETALRLGLIFAYLLALGRSPQIRRVFGYHGAEHRVVNAYEAGLPVRVESAATTSRIHDRCGTTFLLLVALVAAAVHLVVGDQDLWLLLASRVVLLPVVAGLAYEAMRLAAAHAEARLSRLVSGPGHLLQRLTTAEPDDGMIEVAVVALRAAIDPADVPADALVEVAGVVREATPVAAPVAA